MRNHVTILPQAILTMCWDDMYMVQEAKPGEACVYQLVDIYSLFFTYVFA